MTEPSAVAASFINLDVDLRSSQDLSPIADYLGDHVVVLFIGEAFEGFLLVIEGVTGNEMSNDPIELTDHFIGLFNALPQDLAALWDSCASRVFDYGFDGGREAPPTMLTLPSDRLSAIAGLRADVRVTVYPFHDL